ncbi:hypothetical protein BT69DRAFT_1344100 [Atractiella rhizophila]|nr:hypothetical protein BT69DRAFT_1344100 [Atractiella rhizophila]
MLRITFVLPVRFWRFHCGPSKSTYFSLEGIENGVECDDAVNLSMTLGEKSIMVTFADVKHHASVHDDSNSNLQPFTCMFHRPDTRSEVMFQPIALYFEEEGSSFLSANGRNQASHPPVWGQSSKSRALQLEVQR